jgi:hypothetical protein
MDAYRDSNGAQTLVYGPLEASFEAFWDHYPRKAAKAAARKAFAKAIGKAKLAEIVEGARRYAADPNREAAYTCHASTWLNQERWGDPPLPAPSGRRTGGEARMDAYQRIHDNIGRPLIEVLAELEDGYEQP